MVHELKLVISEKGEDIDTVIKETDTDPLLLLKSLEEFKHLANTAITKLIGRGDNENSVEEDSSESEEEEMFLKAKRKKKL